MLDKISKHEECVIKNNSEAIKPMLNKSPLGSSDNSKETDRRNIQ